MQSWSTCNRQWSKFKISFHKTFIGQTNLWWQFGICKTPLQKAAQRQWKACQFCIVLLPNPIAGQVQLKCTGGLYGHIAHGRLNGIFVTIFVTFSPCFDSSRRVHQASTDTSWLPCARRVPKQYLADFSQWGSRWQKCGTTRKSTNQKLLRTNGHADTAPNSLHLWRGSEWSREICSACKALAAKMISNSMSWLSFTIEKRQNEWNRLVTEKTVASRI